MKSTRGPSASRSIRVISLTICYTLDFFRRVSTLEIALGERQGKRSCAQPLPEPTAHREPADRNSARGRAVDPLSCGSVRAF